MKNFFIAFISWMFGAYTMWLANPPYRPVVKLVIWTNEQKINIPLTEKDAAIFTNPRTNQLIIQGITIDKL